MSEVGAGAQIRPVQLKYPDGRDAPQEALGALGIQVATWPVPNAASPLLEKTSLGDDEKEAALQAMDLYFEKLKQEQGYQSRDLIVLHPDVPKLDEMLGKFDRCHTHDDDEVRYIVDGEGVFGFVLPDGRQVHLTVEAGEYINVPAGTEHWFYLTERRRIKAVRYFSGTEGWTPKYTDTPIQPRAA